MDTRCMDETAQSSKTNRNEQVTQMLRQHYEAQRAVRVGICLLNAGEYEQARQAFLKAKALGYADQSLPSFLASSLVGLGDKCGAVAQFEEAASADPTSEAALIRVALAQWEAGKRDAAIETLRAGIAEDSESAEIHFQLGTLLSSEGHYEEAELRFTQVISLDAHHCEAYVSLALCYGANKSMAEATRCLKQAQRLRPSDPRIGLLLAQALKALGESGQCSGIAAVMPLEQDTYDLSGVEELAGVIENEPDFVDAFMALTPDETDQTLYSLLLQTLRVALERQPEHAELHFHCGQVLARLGRAQDAIEANEKAVAIDKRLTRALVELGKLYAQTDRRDDALLRLEQAIEAGAVYADVYYTLGNLHRDGGHVASARSAYRRALSINADYCDARLALESLSA